MKPSITVYDDTQVKVIFPYNKEVIDELKSAIPGSARRYRPADKCWLVHQDFAIDAKEILDSRFTLGVTVSPEVEERISRIQRHERAES